MVTPARRRSRPALMFVVVGVLVALAIAAALAACGGPVRDDAADAAFASHIRGGLEDAKAKLEALQERLKVYMEGLGMSQGDQDDHMKILADVSETNMLMIRPEHFLLPEVGSELQQGRPKKAAAALEEAQNMLHEAEAKLDRMEKRD